MQGQLDASHPGLIQILGVNKADGPIDAGTGNPDPWYSSGNSSITSGRDLPWLQDVDLDADLQSDVWDELWGVTWRDVVILDADNVQVGVFNLTSNPLDNLTNFAALKQLLIDATTP